MKRPPAHESAVDGKLVLLGIDGGKAGFCLWFVTAINMLGVLEWRLTVIVNKGSSSIVRTEWRDKGQ